MCTTARPQVRGQIQNGSCAHVVKIAVGIALVAHSRQIIAIVLAGAGRLLALGIALGIGMTVVAERVLKTLLFGVSPLDPSTLASAVSLLAAISLIAAFLLARRTAAVDPLEAIGAE